MSTDLAQTYTMGALAAEIGRPDWWCDYHLRRAGVRPIGRAAHYRIYDGSALDALRNVVATREAGAHVGK